MAGSGDFNLQTTYGRTDGTNRPAGYVGEIISSQITSANAVTLTTGTPMNLFSLPLTAGDWFIYGNVVCISSFGLTVFSNVQAGLSLVSGTLPDACMIVSNSFTALQTVNIPLGFTLPPLRNNVNAAFTAYVAVMSAFSLGTMKVCGNIGARRLS